MSSDLQTYKQNRINELTREFNTRVARLNSILSVNIKRVLASRLRNQVAVINGFINQYNIDIATLRNIFNQAIASVNTFKPEFVVDQENIKSKKALLIGINYIDTPYELNGCIDDASRIKSLLETHGFTDFKILTDKTDIKPTKTNILNEFKNFITSANSGDLLFFYFSGHGSYALDRNNDENDNRDEMIVSCDLQGVIDDELKSIMQNNIKRDVTIIGLFDSCHSGTILDLKYNYLDSSNYDKYSENNKVGELSGNAIMISGCMDSQTSSEALINNKAQGAMTWSFIDCLNKQPNCSWRELVKLMRETLKTSGFSQVPQLSTDSFYDIDSNVFI